LPSGVPGLDDVLGGGIPEYSFNLIAGEPGSGKTTLSQQILFANATAERRALYFTVLGEPALKMVRYLQQMEFFDAEKVGTAIELVDLSPDVLKQDLGVVLEKIVSEVKRVAPAFVIVDSFRTVIRAHARPDVGEVGLQSFLQRLALYLTSWEVTSFLVGEYLEPEIQNNPIFTVADGILWLTQHTQRSSVVRKLQVMKLRGQASMPGLHTFRIDAAGLHVFPRLAERLGSVTKPGPESRLSMGCAGLDRLLHGGLPVGDSLLVAGPAGVGKTTIATQFLASAPEGERSVLVIFEEQPHDYLQRAKSLGHDLDGAIRRGALELIALRPLDLSVDETLQAIQNAVIDLDARRLVIDSLTGFELALAPPFREDYRESLYRMMGALSGAGVTIVLTVEVTEAWDELRFSPHAVSFLTENLILMRYAEIGAALKKVLAVVKMRRSSHSPCLHAFDITTSGLVVGPALTEYGGILTGDPRRRELPVRPVYPGLTEQEELVLGNLLTSTDATPESIAESTGLERTQLSRALGRLVALNYALEIDEGGVRRYRPVAQVLGQR